MVQAHGREMILPARLGDGFRNIISRGPPEPAPAPPRAKTGTLNAKYIGGGRSIAHHDELGEAARCGAAISFSGIPGAR